jgi:3-phenylpropionate/trans-cinnamate dioxygenase ferredoxin reductase subunit
MARAVTPVISEHFLDIHRQRGVHVELGAKVVGLSGRTGHVASVETADGKSWPADAVVIGIGVIPNDDLGRALGLACDAGVIVDACSRTSNPAVVAAGDCTARRMDDGRLLRLESVHNAVEQGKSAAAALMGRDRPFVATPWFWSDQYEEKLQMAGLSAGHDRTVIRGSRDGNAFSAFYFRDGKLLGSDSVNQPKDHMATRRMLDKKVNPTPEQAADSSFNFQTLLK